MKDFLFLVLISVLFALLLFTQIMCPAHAGELDIGLSQVPASHSEQVSDRCMNDGWAVDVGYTWTPLELNYKGLFGVDLGLGLLGTYSNIESAYRDHKGAPQSEQARESCFTMLGVVKPGLKIWRVKGYLLFGAGGDWSTHESFDTGQLTDGYGIDVDITDDITVGVSYRTFDRAGTFYKYETVNITFKF